MDHIRSVLHIRVLIVLIAAMGNTASSKEPFFGQTDVFVSGTEEYHMSRILSIVVSNEGTILAFAESHGFHMFNSGDIDVCLKPSFDGGQTWKPVQVIWSEGPRLLSMATRGKSVST